MVTVTGIKLEGLNISELLKEEFVNKLGLLEMNLVPISLVFVKETHSGEKKDIVTASISHNSNIEVQQKLINLSSLDEALLRNIEKTLQELGAK